MFPIIIVHNICFLFDRYEWRNECERRDYCTRVQCAWLPSTNNTVPPHEQPPEQRGLRLPMGWPGSIQLSHGSIPWPWDAPEAATLRHNAASVTAPLPGTWTVPAQWGHGKLPPASSGRLTEHVLTWRSVLE